MTDLCLWARAPSMLNGTESKAQLASFVWEAWETSAI